MQCGRSDRRRPRPLTVADGERRHVVLGELVNQRASENRVEEAVQGTRGVDELPGKEYVRADLPRRRRAVRGEVGDVAVRGVRPRVELVFRRRPVVQARARAHGHDAGDAAVPDRAVAVPAVPG